GDHQVTLPAESVLLDDHRPAAGGRRTARGRDREGDLRRVDHDRVAAPVAGEALVGGLARRAARAVDEGGRQGKVAEHAVAVRVVSLEARAAEVAGRDRLQATRGAAEE